MKEQFFRGHLASVYESLKIFILFVLGIPFLEIHPKKLIIDGDQDVYSSIKLDSILILGH